MSIRMGVINERSVEYSCQVLKHIKIICLLMACMAKGIAIDMLEAPTGLMVFEDNQAIDRINKELTQQEIMNKCNSDIGCYTKLDFDIFSQKVKIIVPVDIRCVRTNKCIYQIRNIVNVTVDDIKRQALIKSTNTITRNFYKMSIWNSLKNNYNLMTTETLYYASYKQDGIEVFVNKLNYKKLINELNLMKRTENLLNKKRIICAYPKSEKE